MVRLVPSNFSTVPRILTGGAGLPNDAIAPAGIRKNVDWPERAGVTR